MSKSRTLGTYMQDGKRSRRTEGDGAITNLRHSTSIIISKFGMDLLFTVRCGTLKTDQPYARIRYSIPPKLYLNMVKILIRVSFKRSVNLVADLARGSQRLSNVKCLAI